MYMRLRKTASQIFFWEELSSNGLELFRLGWLSLVYLSTFTSSISQIMRRKNLNPRSSNSMRTTKLCKWKSRNSQWAPDVKNVEKFSLTERLWQINSSLWLIEDFKKTFGLMKEKCSLRLPSLLPMKHPIFMELIPDKEVLSLQT